MMKNHYSLSWRSIITYLKNTNHKVVGKDPTPTTKSMKSSWLMNLSICFLLLTGTFSFAQTITVGTGTSTQRYPLGNLYGFERSASLYTAAEVSATGTITKLSWYANTANAIVRPIKIYLTTTTSSTLATSTWADRTTGAELVYDGSVSIVAGWNEFTLPIPFNYAGGADNLLVLVEANGGGSGLSGSTASIRYSSAPSRHHYIQKDGSEPITELGSVTGNRPNIQISFPATVAPSCATALLPADLAVDIARNTSFSWVESGLATSFDVYLGTSTNPPFVGNVTTSSYTPATLAPNTTYYWKVVPKNAIGDAVGCSESSFTTGAEFNYCAPTYSSGCSNGARIESVSTTSAITNLSNLLSGCASTTATGYSDYTSTIQMSASRGTSFDISVAVANYGGGVKVWIDYNQDGTFDPSELVTASAGTIPNGSSHIATISIPVTANLGNTRMRVRVVENSTTFDACSSQSYGETEDYLISFEEAPACLAPTALAVSDLSNTSAILSWTASASTPSNGYDIYYSTTDVAPTAATVPTEINYPASPYTVSGLTSETTYYWWVRSDCGATESLWTAGGSFYTGYCIPTGTGNYFISDVTTTGGETNITNASGDDGGYGDFSATHSVSAITGQTVDITVTANTSTHWFYGWIDWNNDLDFDDADEAIFAATSGYAISHTATIQIPAGTPVGNYRMRVASTWSGAITSCGSTNGEYEDYTFTVAPQMPCTGTPVAATITSSVADICVSGTVTMTAVTSGSPDSGFSYQWYNSGGAIAGETGLTFTSPVLTAPETYYYETTCANGGLTSNSNSITVGVNNPEVLTTTPATRCGTGSVDLAATASTGATLNWFANATGGTALATGTSYTTPSISATTSYYVEAMEGGTVEYAGKLAASANTSFINNTYGIVFNMTNTATLASTVIYPTGTGTVTIALYNSAGTELMSTTAIPVTGSGLSTPVTVPLNFVVPTGTGYRLQLKAYTGITNLVRESSGNTFPYNSTNTSVTAGWTGSSTSSSYYFFYNLEVTTGCSSARTEVIATVTAPPTLTLSSIAESVCDGESTSLITMTAGSTDYDSFVWSPATGVNGDEINGFTFDAATSTVYTLTASQTIGSLCASTTDFTVTVNPIPTPVIVTPASATLCVDAIETLSVTGGTIDGPSGKIGTQTNTNLTTTPFKTNWGGVRTQAIYTAAELTAMGLMAGHEINSIGYVALSGTPALMNDFTISAGFTATANIGTDFIGGATNTVLAQTAYTPPTGTGNIDFALTNNLVWDGVSNLLIETCFNNNNSGSGSSVSVESSTVATGLVKYLSDDNEPALCSSTDAPSSSTTRPNLRFSTMVSTDVTWSPVDDLYTDAAATVPYVAGENAATVYVKPTAAGSIMYAASATNSATNCASTDFVSVTATDNTTNTTTEVACGSFTWSENSVVYTTSGLYEVITGCHTEILDLTITPFATNTTTETVCDTYTWAVNNVTYTTSGMYSDTTGCDIEYLDLTITPSTSSLTTETACDSYIWAVDNVEYTTSGTYVVTTGCVTDSLVLTINPSTTNTTTVSTCDTYTWSVNGEVYTTSGTYTVTTGCDEEVLELTINVSPLATITRTGDVLKVNATSGATYQWGRCDGPFTPIAGATSQSYQPTELGSYAVRVTKNGCSVTSDCFEVTTLDVKSLEVANLNLYPNPVSDALTVTYTKTITGIQVYDMTGRLLKNINTSSNEVSVDMSEMPASVYIIKVTAENATSEFRVVKN